MVSEAHFHVDNIKIGTSDDSYVLQETFDEDFLVLPGESAEYSYNHNDERVSKSVNGSATYYLTDGNGQVLSEYDNNNALVFNYLYAHGRKMARINSSSAVQYFSHDYLGSVRELINSDGSVEWNRGYYPFGAERYAEGLGNGYKFTGKERDEEISLDYSWHRFYDYELGRFTQVDPLWQKYPSLTPYNYCGNNPVTRTDPTGMVVEFSEEDEAQKTANSINDEHGGKSGITVTEAEKKTFSLVKTIKNVFSGEFSIGYTTSKIYQLSTEASSFNFSQNEFTSALHDVINSKEITFNVDLTTINYLYGSKSLSMQESGGGQLFSRVGGGTVLVDPRGWVGGGESLGVVFLHEVLGHGHSVGGNNALRVNNHYGSSRIGDHYGYDPIIGWKK